MEKIDIIIVGAGVVGLAVAAELTKRFTGRDVLILEKHGKFGQETSSRNSEVIHAGMYYPTASLKARLCVEGNTMLYDFCDKYTVPYNRTGKLIIARNEAEIPAIEPVFAQGKTNGVNGLQLIGRRELNRLEPNITGVAAIYSPSTGIIDSHKLMARLEHIALEGSAMIAYMNEVTNVRQIADGYEVLIKGPDGAEDSLACNWLINCAGLTADFIPACLGIDIVAAGYKIYPVKGEYFSLSAGKSKMISHLLYPPPLTGLKGLGTHITKSLDGRARLGPNAFYVQTLTDYDVDASHLEEFYQAAVSFLPVLTPDDLQPDMAGLRPKIQAPDAPAADFVVCHEQARNLPGLINLIGIESPGLTSSLALGKMVADIIDENR